MQSIEFPGRLDQRFEPLDRGRRRRAAARLLAQEQERQQHDDARQQHQALALETIHVRQAQNPFDNPMPLFDFPALAIAFKQPRGRPVHLAGGQNQALAALEPPHDQAHERALAAAAGRAEQRQAVKGDEHARFAAALARPRAHPKRLVRIMLHLGVNQLAGLHPDNEPHVSGQPFRDQVQTIKSTIHQVNRPTGRQLDRVHQEGVVRRALGEAQ